MHWLSTKLAFRLLLQRKALLFGGTHICGHCFAIHWSTLDYCDQETIQRAIKHPSNILQPGFDASFLKTATAKCSRQVISHTPGLPLKPCLSRQLL